MGSRILLADDSITIQKVVNLTFQDEGIEVVSVSNGDMAERRLKEVNPDLVLADIFMPGKNGYELCESIKQDPELSMVPVILLVGAFEPFNEAEARRVHADAHLTKPFESRVLVETVRTLMDKYPKPQSAPVATPVVPEVAATFPTTQAMPNAPFNLDTTLMGEPGPTAFGNQEFPPLPTQTAQPKPVFTDQAPLTNFADASSFADAFPSTFENQAQQTPSFTIGEPAQQPGDFPAPAQAGGSQPVQDFIVDSPQVTTNYQEAPLQLDESANLNPELVNFYEQYDKSPSAQDLTRTLGSYTPPVEPAGPAETAFDLVVDFDKVETLEEPKPDQVVGFDVDGLADTAPANYALPHQPAINTDTTPVARKFDTNELESTSGRAANGHQPVAPATNSVMHDQPEFSATASQGLPEVSSHSEILAAEEPLGDLLTNLPPLVEPVEATAAQSPLELDEPYFAAAQTPAAPAQTANDEAPVLITETPGETVAPTAGQSALAEPQTVHEVATPAAAAETLSPAEVSLPELQSVEVHTSEPTPVAEPFAQAQSVTEMVSVPAAAETPSPYNGLDKEHSEGHLLAEFTPVNLETAVPHSTAAESSTLEPVSENTSAATPASQALDEQLASVPKLPSSPQNEALNHQGGDMSQEMIDEIVRRVVAQLSDSVVREIAWEVVPDCVERVVNNLTREGITNKLTN